MGINEIQQLLDTIYMPIDDLLDSAGIHIIESERVPEQYDAMLINKDMLFLRDNTPSPYRNFLILHELGHYFCQYDKDISFAYTIRMSRSRAELEANTFACLYLLKDENLENTDIIELWKHRGVPEKVALKVYDYMLEQRLSENF